MSIDASTLSVRIESKGIKETADGLNSVYKEAKKAEDRVVTLTSKIEKLSNAFTQGSATAQAFMQAMGNAKASSSGTDAVMRALTSSVDKLSAGIKSLNGNLSNLDMKSRESAAGINFNTNAMKDAHAAARGLSGALGALWITYGNMIPLAAGLAIGASFKQIVSIGSSVENTLEGIRVRGNETLESIDNIRKSVIELGKGVYGPQEVAKAFETMILAGLSAKQAISGIADALNLATVGGTSIEKSAYTLVQIGTALGYSAESYNRISDVIAKTAAVSMSSVESLSEAFKAASAVGKLYGASLEDIGTSLAALSNLGIQGSAAGTALKNFYKELASNSDKVKQTLADLKLTPNDLKDAKGNFLDLLSIMNTLNKGYSNLTEAEQKRATANITNERGSKLMVEALDLFRKKVGETENGLKDLRDQIDNSFGYAAISAAQMSLTVENQFKSVKNTLQTVFASVGKEISPQLSLVASELKKVFNSTEFADGIRFIAKELSDFGIVIASNLPMITKMVEVFLGMKAFVFLVEVFTAVRAAMIGLTGAAAAANIALGPLTAALMAAGAAYIYFKGAKQDSDLSNTAKVAIQNSNDYATALDNEASRLRTQIELLKQGKSAREAETQAVYEQQLALSKSQGLKAKLEAEARLDRAGSNVTLKDLEISDSIVKRGGMATAAVKEFRAAQANLAKVNTEVDASFKRLVEGQKEVINLSKEAEALRRKQVAERPGVDAGTGILTEKHPGGAARANDLYQAELNRIQGMVEAAKRELKKEESKNDSLFKTGQIGRLEQIQRNGEAAIAMYEKEAAAYQRMIDVAHPKNKEAVRASIGNKLQAAQDNASAEAVRIKEQESIRFAEIDKFTTEHQIKELEARGKYVEANVLRYSELNKVGLGNLDSDIANTEKKVAEAFNSISQNGTASVDELTKKLADLRAAKDAFVAEGGAKNKIAMFNEAQFAFRAPFKEMQNAIEAVNLAAKADGGWEAKFNAAGAANTIRAKAIPALQEMSDKVMQIARESGNDLLIQQAEKIVGSLQRESLGLDSMWEDAAKGAEDFASRMESSFGGAIGAIGKLTAAMADQRAAQEKINLAQQMGKQLAGKDQTKLAAVNLKAIKDGEKAELASYANIAGASKGLFNEKSKGYKALQAVEQTFRAFQLASEMEVFVKKMFYSQTELSQKLVADKIKTLSAEESAGEIIGLAMAQAQAETEGAIQGTTAVVTGNEIKAASNLAGTGPAMAKGASEMFAQSGWWGFAGVAAMIAVMASLGFSGGGGASVDVAKQRQQSQGTGTVLGDESAKSESLSKSLELLKSNSDIALTYSSSMVGYLRSINSGISGMAAAISQVSGIRGTSADQFALGVGSSRSFAGFSSSSTELVDSGISFDRVKTAADIAADAASMQEYKKKLDQISKGTGMDVDSIPTWFIGSPKSHDSSQTIGSILDSGVFASKYAQLHSESSSFWGLSQDSSDETKRSALDADITNGFTKTVNSMFNAVITTATQLGGDKTTIGNAIRNISIQDAIGRDQISLKGLSGADVEKELASVFSALGDKMAQAAMPGFEKFSKNGEGYLQTLIRVSNGVEVAKYSLEKLGITAIKYSEITDKQGDVATEMVRDSIVAQEQVSRAMTDSEKVAYGFAAAIAHTTNGFADGTVKVANGIGEIIQAMDGTAEDLANTYKQLVQIRDLMNSTGLSGNNLSRDTIRGAGGLDVLKTGMNDFFSNFYTEAEQATIKTGLLRKEFEALGKPLPATKEAFKALVKAADDGTESGNRLVGKLLSLAGAFSEASDASEKAAKDVKDNLLEAADKAFDVLSKAIEAEKKRVTDLYAAQIKAVKEKAESEVTLQKKALKAAQDASNAINTIFESLKNAIKSTQVESAALTIARRREAEATLTSALGFANSGGDLTKFGNLNNALDAISKPTEQFYSTFQDYMEDQTVTGNLIQKLADTAEKQKDKAQLTIDAINATIDSINSTSEAQIASLEAARDAELARLDGILTTAQAQLDALRGIDNSVKSVEGALAAFNSAVTSAKAATSASASGIGTTASSGYVIANGRLTGTVNGIQNFNGVSVGNGTYWDSLRGFVNVPTRAKGGYTPAGLTLVGEEGPELVNFANPSQIYTASQTLDIFSNASSGVDYTEVQRRSREEARRSVEDARQAQQADLAAAINRLEQCIMSGDIANVQQTKELVKYIKRWDSDGMPDVRDISE